MSDIIFGLIVFIFSFIIFIFREKISRNSDDGMKSFRNYKDISHTPYKQAKRMFTIGGLFGIIIGLYIIISSLLKL